jgi:hypothetical protein
MEIIKTIALLCQLSGATSTPAEVDYLERKQLECQKYYVKCMDGGFLGDYKNISKCMIQKK